MNDALSRIASVHGNNPSVWNARHSLLLPNFGLSLPEILTQILLSRYLIPHKGLNPSEIEPQDCPNEYVLRSYVCLSEID